MVVVKVVEPVDIEALSPTQLCVGWWEVGKRAARLQTRPDEEIAALVERKILPVVLGPGGRKHLLDGHHFALALATSGRGQVVQVEIVADLRRGSYRQALERMRSRGWLYLRSRGIDEDDLEALPESLADCSDDPHRSLAWAVRKAGGFGKSLDAYAEFAWADYFRERLPLAPDTPIPTPLVQRARRLAHRVEAAHLPGWLRSPASKPELTSERGTRRRAA